MEHHSLHHIIVALDGYINLKSHEIAQWSLSNIVQSAMESLAWNDSVLTFYQPYIAIRVQLNGSIVFNPSTIPVQTQSWENVSLHDLVWSNHGSKHIFSHQISHDMRNSFKKGSIYVNLMYPGSGPQCSNFQGFSPYKGYFAFKNLWWNTHSNYGCLNVNSLFLLGENSLVDRWMVRWSMGKPGNRQPRLVRSGASLLRAVGALNEAVARLEHAIMIMCYDHTFVPQHWVNYNSSPIWIKAIWGWFPLLTNDFSVSSNSEVVIKFTQQQRRWISIQASPCFTGGFQWHMVPASCHILAILYWLAACW